MGWCLSVSLAFIVVSATGKILKFCKTLKQHNASISEKTVMNQNCKSQQYYNFWTTIYLIITLFYSFPSKQQNCVLSTMKKTFPMLCTQSPCVHSYHFTPGMCLLITGPYYMNIHWMYCKMTKLKHFFGHINITVSKCFFNNNSLFSKI